MSNQQYTCKLPAEFSPSMVNFSSKSPQDCLTLISASINNFIMADQCSALDYQDSPFLQDAEITVNPNPISVNGYILSIPSIYYGNAALNKPVVQLRHHLIYLSFIFLIYVPSFV
ncbi:hypothetical protein K503DRAFT_806646 [Rhizopogon vinicolor AM-OR11-026]|uniref:Uncharacterized protein n=1 Tax=Rhizopogon vinicolor AM-OR11-026 TaxID=1314800 RepID=A0A1B7ME28_9AGAM|nr:hypothetical protein K503DRAFT_806646 [Rhizopogon vinicolor AM-OR11-026]